MKKNEQQTHITLSQCPTEPCAIFYTDTLSRSLDVVCKNPKHTIIDIDTEKRVNAAGAPNESSTQVQQQNTKRVDDDQSSTQTQDRHLTTAGVNYYDHKAKQHRQT